MKPYHHARNSVKRWGGVPEDYLPCHNFMDSSKAHLADVRHRAMLHNSWGIFILEQVFGTYITNSSGIKVQVRDIGEQHVLEDLGTIPTVQDWLSALPKEQWHGGPVVRVKRTITITPHEED